MKRLPREPNREVATAVLYRDDIEEIIALCGDEVTIADDEYEFASLDEMVERRGTSPRALYLSGANIYLRLRTFGYGTYLSGTGANIGALYAVRAVIERRRTFLGRIAVPWAWYTVAFAFCLLYVAQLLGRFTIVSLGLLGYGWMIMLLFAFLTTILAGGFGTRIHLTLRHETSTFWSRNAEKLISGAIGAALGAAGTGGFDWLVGYLRH